MLIEIPRMLSIPIKAVSSFKMISLIRLPKWIHKKNILKLPHKIISLEFKDNLDFNLKVLADSNGEGKNKDDTKPNRLTIDTPNEPSKWCHYSK